MERDPTWLRKLAEAYFDHSVHQDLPLDDDAPLFPEDDRAGSVISQVLGLLPDEPDACWQFIQIASELPLTAEQLGLLGAGVFEDLMDEEGGRFIERVEQAVIRSAAMQEIVNGAWTMSMNPVVARHIEALQSPPLGAKNAAMREDWRKREQ